MSAHTEGRLVVSGNIVRGADGNGAIADTSADARRLAACWNACIGVPTDVIEALGDGFLDKGLNVVKTLTDERNELKARLGNSADWNVREAELAAARALLGELAGELTTEGMDTTVVRIRALLNGGAA